MTSWSFWAILARALAFSASGEFELPGDDRKAFSAVGEFWKFSHSCASLAMSALAEDRLVRTPAIAV